MGLVWYYVTTNPAMSHLAGALSIASPLCSQPECRSYTAAIQHLP
jgi:hypothetical protein